MVLNTYEVIDTVNSAIQADHFPNLESVSRKLSGRNASTYEQLTHYAQRVVYREHLTILKSSFSQQS